MVIYIILITSLEIRSPNFLFPFFVKCILSKKLPSSLIIVSLKEIVNKPIKEIKIRVNSIAEITKLKKLSTENGRTKVIIQIKDNGKILDFELDKLRNIDYNIINSLQLTENLDFN